jgi:heptaprenyl diphosphate synthase
MAPNAPRAVRARRPELDPFRPVRAALERVEAAIRGHLSTDDRMLQDVSTHLRDGGGKRLRPALVLLSGRAAGAPAEALCEVASAVEIIHMATLVHDDMVDGAAVRRGVPTVHAKWGQDVSVLLGDYLFAKGFGILSSQGNNRVVRIMSDVVFRMCAGEIRELVEQWDAGLGEAAYFSRVEAKTAYFIAECCRLGAVVAGAPQPVEESLALYGAAVGLSFQIIDDVLDLVASPETLGKPAGADLRAGVVTLPVLYALDHSPDAASLRSVLESRRVGDAEVALARNLIQRCGAVEYAYRRAAELAREAQVALEAAVDPSPARAALAGLAQHLIGRTC